MTVTNRVPKIIEWDASASEFYGGVNEDNELVNGLVTPEHPERGAIFSLNRKWVITADKGKLETIIQVFYQFRNNKQKPSIEQLFELTKDAAKTATELLNNEFKRKNIDIIPRDVPVLILDGNLHSILESFITKAYPEN